MSLTSSSAPSASASAVSLTDNGTALGAATYYGAIALAIVVIVGLTITSVNSLSRGQSRSKVSPADYVGLEQRVLYTRRARIAHERERMELQRRGEEGGLPTYLQTTAPHTLSYFSSSPSFLRPPQSIDPSRAPDALGGPPAYHEPPKYEDGCEQRFEHAQEGSVAGVTPSEGPPPTSSISTSTPTGTPSDGQQAPHAPLQEVDLGLPRRT